MDIRTQIRIGGLWWKAAAVAVLAVTLTTACSKGEGATGPAGAAPPPATPVGSYTLSTIDAKVLPYTMFADTGYTLEVMSGTISITANGKWVSKVVTRETVAGNVSTYSDSTYGSWTVPGGAMLAVLTNAETGATTNATWTAIDVTVNDVDGTVTRKVVYLRN